MRIFQLARSGRFYVALVLSNQTLDTGYPERPTGRKGQAFLALHHYGRHVLRWCSSSTGCTTSLISQLFQLSELQNNKP